MPLVELRSSPYDLEQGDVVKAIVQSLNVNGWSPLSNVNTAGGTVQVEPHQMSAPQSITSLTSQSQLSVEWDALSSLVAMGGVEVTSYNLQWDKATGGNEWFDLIGYSPSQLELSTTVTSDVVGGNTY